MTNTNPLGLDGIEFVEFSSHEPEKMEQLFLDFGFSKVGKHRDKKIDLYQQGGITFLLNYQPGSRGYSFQTAHGPCISAMGWRFKDSNSALEKAQARGAKACTSGDYDFQNSALPAIYGIGESLIYFTNPELASDRKYSHLGFVPLSNPVLVPEKGFYQIDHLTNNVYKGTMQKWASFYKDIFAFTEVRYFDIKGAKTGLTSYALRSPCGQFCIPINEANEEKSQINEYLNEYKGPGVQHLAFLTKDLISSVRKLDGTRVQMLDINPEYYEEAFSRVPTLKEDKKSIQELNILVDGDANGYLLQIFTKNIIGPIFIELIQRENHLSFGEGNFQALFNSIERDQMKRGVL